jgi:hypothetical protein
MEVNPNRQITALEFLEIQIGLLVVFMAVPRQIITVILQNYFIATGDKIIRSRP